MSFDIQAAIDALPADGGEIHIPTGTILLTRPLRISRSNFILKGEGRSSTFIRSIGQWEGPVALSSPNYPSITTAPSLVSGPGASMVLNGTNAYYLNLRDSTTMNLDGLQKFCLELFYRPTSDTTDQWFLQNIIACQGRRIASEPISRCFSLDHFEGNRIRVSLNVGGTPVALESPKNAVSVGQVYHLALSYDGFTIRQFINGNIVSSAAATGTVKQQPHEDCTIGPAVQDWPETTFLDNMAKGEIDSVRISKTERYTANFTPPIAKHVKDSNTLMLLNFSNLQDIFVVGETFNLNAWLPLRRQTTTEIVGVNFRDLQFQGTGPFFFHCPSFTFDGVWFLTISSGVFFQGNCYLVHFRDIMCLADGTPSSRGAFVSSVSGALAFDGVNQFVGSAYPFVSTGGSGICSGLFIAPNQYTRIPMLLKGRTGGNSVYTFPQTLVDDEPFIPPGFIRPIECGIALDDVYAQFIGATLETIHMLPGPRANIWIDKADATFSGVKFNNTSTAEIVKIITPPPTRKIAIRDCQKPAPNAWADDLSKCLIENS